MSYLITEEENYESYDEISITNENKVNNSKKEIFSNLNNKEMNSINNQHDVKNKVKLEEDRHDQIEKVEKSLKRIIKKKFVPSDIMLIKGFVKNLSENLDIYQKNENLILLLSKFILNMNYMITSNEISDYSTLIEYKHILELIRKSGLKLTLNNSCFNITTIIEDILSGIITCHKNLYKKKKGYKRFIKSKTKIEKLEKELESLVNDLGDEDNEYNEEENKDIQEENKDDKIIDHVEDIEEGEI